MATLQRAASLRLCGSLKQRDVFSTVKLAYSDRVRVGRPGFDSEQKQLFVVSLPPRTACGDLPACYLVGTGDG
jgi:hypothetical protein